MNLLISLRLEAALIEEARKRGTDPQAVATLALWERFIPEVLKFEPKDEWERKLMEIGIDCGVSYPSEILSSETYYD